MHTPIQITGVGFFDFKHGQSGVAPNAIELHPVLSIAFNSRRISIPAPAPAPTRAPAQSTSPGSFSLRAWVSPNPMPYGAYPTLHAQTHPGASCTASVIYSTGSRPVSFSGGRQTVPSSGQVAWHWREETSGNGGTGTVSCTDHGQTKSATANFSVTG